MGNEVQKAVERLDAESLANADALTNLNEIGQSEPEMSYALRLVIKHIHGCYSDKYAKGQEAGIDTKAQLYGPNGMPINVYQTTRYLQRYITQGSKKSGLLIDLFKGIHYMLFEIVRRIRNNDVELNEPAK